ncbi:aminopeptidase N [Pseudomarimonas salicorniae]|uniref:Aminopeptidase N n=1 Tax=Pseudomarimonas salicorniae TaxID=2933270 RepID=A0ABT0GCY4_9GAMM|nr:aminopeptidase N [Lysobacter sp. CAU 1642]MCK7592390.1 aminopeptidase N [Lysobacter sp. CAU 1642]
MSVVRLADYQAPDWRILHTRLVFELDPERSLVNARLELERLGADDAPLRLHGEELDLLSLRLDGRVLRASEYRYLDGVLEIASAPARCVLETTVAISPQANTRLEGLYVSGPMLLTQCEAEGFRRITFFIDQPDVQSSFDVELRADKARYPVLLSNGNPTGSGELEDGRHWARWHDPHPKPAYLFAVVAGDIDCVMAPFTTMDGRKVEVRVWAERRDVPRCQYALEATLRAMRWDEERFGRAYDLDQFNIVATQHFTMGAMENKGLNIFNARYVLADARSATDADYEAIESVIGHEYFHNWSGNRVTLRDWFQLSLKEGLTVFRDQEFTADLRSRGVKRIADVRLLRARQFVEDSGPLAHPVRPPEYAEINNFYTATVYEKGAEVIRMLHTLVGEATFRRALDRYFSTHDGQSATVEDLLAAIAVESGRDLSQFKRWYEQAGTPQVEVEDEFDAASGRYRLRIRQHTAPTPGQPDKEPLHLPLRIALYDAEGRDLSARLKGDAERGEGLLELRGAEHTVELDGLDAKPLPAFLHGLSAPVRLRYAYSAAELGRLVGVEQDPLLRWDAMQRLAHAAIVERSAAHRDALIEASGQLLKDAAADPAFIAECLLLPDVATLADACSAIDFDALIKEREDLLDLLAETHSDASAARYAALARVEPDALSPAAAAARRLKNVLLPWLTRLDPEARAATTQFREAGTMTDRLGALACLLHFDAPAAPEALAAFRSEWAEDLLVTDKWIGLKVTRPQPETLDEVRALLGDRELWQPTNPNRVRAVLGAFGRSNPVAMHRKDGAGYELYAEQVVALDAINPQVSARLATALEQWRRLDSVRRPLAEASLKRIREGARSRDLNDVVTRLLEG